MAPSKGKEPAEAHDKGEQGLAHLRQLVVAHLGDSSSADTASGDAAAEQQQQRQLERALFTKDACELYKLHAKDKGKGKQAHVGKQALEACALVLEHTLPLVAVRTSHGTAQAGGKGGAGEGDKKGKGIPQDGKQQLRCQGDDGVASKNESVDVVQRADAALTGLLYAVEDVDDSNDAQHLTSLQETIDECMILKLVVQHVLRDLLKPASTDELELLWHSIDVLIACSARNKVIKAKLSELLPPAWFLKVLDSDQDSSFSSAALELGMRVHTGKRHPKSGADFFTQCIRPLLVDRDTHARELEERWSKSLSKDFFMLKQDTLSTLASLDQSRAQIVSVRSVRLGDNTFLAGGSNTESKLLVSVSHAHLAAHVKDSVKGDVDAHVMASLSDVAQATIYKNAHNETRTLELALRKPVRLTSRPKHEPQDSRLVIECSEGESVKLWTTLEYRSQTYPGVFPKDGTQSVAVSAAPANKSGEQPSQPPRPTSTLTPPPAGQESAHPGPPPHGPSLASVSLNGADSIAHAFKEKSAALERIIEDTASAASSAQVSHSQISDSPQGEDRREPSPSIPLPGDASTISNTERATASAVEEEAPAPVTEGIVTRSRTSPANKGKRALVDDESQAPPAKRSNKSRRRGDDEEDESGSDKAAQKSVDTGAETLVVHEPPKSPAKKYGAASKKKEQEKKGKGRKSAAPTAAASKRATRSSTRKSAPPPQGESSEQGSEESTAASAGEDEGSDVYDFDKAMAGESTSRSKTAKAAAVGAKGKQAARDKTTPAEAHTGRGSSWKTRKEQPSATAQSGGARSKSFKPSSHAGRIGHSLSAQAEASVSHGAAESVETIEDASTEPATSKKSKRRSALDDVPPPQPHKSLIPPHVTNPTKKHAKAITSMSGLIGGPSQDGQVEHEAVQDDDGMNAQQECDAMEEEVELQQVMQSTEPAAEELQAHDDIEMEHGDDAGDSGIGVDAAEEVPEVATEAQEEEAAINSDPFQAYEPAYEDFDYPHDEFASHVVQQEEQIVTSALQSRSSSALALFPPPSMLGCIELEEGLVGTSAAVDVSGAMDLAQEGGDASMAVVDEDEEQHEEHSNGSAQDAGPVASAIAGHDGGVLSGAATFGQAARVFPHDAENSEEEGPEDLMRQSPSPVRHAPPTVKNPVQSALATAKAAQKGRVEGDKAMLRKKVAFEAPASSEELSAPSSEPPAESTRSRPAALRQAGNAQAPPSMAMAPPTALSGFHFQSLGKHTSATRSAPARKAPPPLKKRQALSPQPRSNSKQSKGTERRVQKNSAIHEASTSSGRPLRREPDDEDASHSSDDSVELIGELFQMLKKRSARELTTAERRDKELFANMRADVVGVAKKLHGQTVRTLELAEEASSRIDKALQGLRALREEAASDPPWELPF